MESDVVRVFSPASLGSPSEEGGNPVGVMATLPDLTESALAEQKRLCSELERLHIRSHHWDASEPQLLVCMTRPDVQGMKHSSENRSTQKKVKENGQGGRRERRRRRRRRRRKCWMEVKRVGDGRGSDGGEGSKGDRREEE